MVFLAAAYPCLRGGRPTGLSGSCDRRALWESPRAEMPARSRFMVGSAKFARVAGRFRIKGRADPLPEALIRLVNTKSFFLAAVLLTVSALQSSARPVAGGGGNPTDPPPVVSK